MQQVWEQLFVLGGHSTDIFKIGLIQILFGPDTSDTDILRNSAKLMYHVMKVNNLCCITVHIVTTNKLSDHTVR
jgi:hypothetical protein